MSLTFAPFSREHWPAAAEILAAGHRANREREPQLPERYGGPAAALEVIENTLKEGSGVVAVRDGRITGYLAGVLEIETLERVAVVLPSGAAIDRGEDAGLYREMYAAAAQRWVENGYFVHYAHVPAMDAAQVQAWYSLGFGRYSLYNWRGLTPVDGPEAEISIRRAGAEAIDQEEALRDSLRRYNATSPILHPYVRPGADERQRLFDAERELMARPDHAYFIAYERDEAVAFMTFTPPQPDYTLTPDGSVYLHLAFVDESARSGGVGAAIVNRGLEWAREQGYKLCTVGYFSPNLLGARFWQGKGFMPLGLCLERRIDPRIAWAKEDE